MGWFFRKSVKFGPLRFNLSKSGLGLSAGVRGARISMGPRGTYVNAGLKGLYYRQKIGGSRSARNTSYPTQQIPQAVVEQLPSYPQLPKHGLPRVVNTLLIIFVVGVIGGALWLSVSLSQMSRQRTAGGPPPVSPVGYRTLQSYMKDGRLLKNVLVQQGLTNEKLIQLAKFLHATDSSSSYRIFDDDAQSQKFMEWDVNYPSKKYSYPKSWADKHYLGDISQRPNPTNGKITWQLTDQKGKLIASLE